MTSIEMCKKIGEKLTEYKMQQEKNEFLSENGRWLATKVIEECRNIVIAMQIEEEDKSE